MAQNGRRQSNTRERSRGRRRRFRDKSPEALYHSSNLNIARFTKKFPFSLKLIGYCRVDPTEGERAVNELRFAREQLGLRGLKLHPRSEGWVDKTATEVPVKVLIEAAKYSMPIIFDTRGKRTILDIGTLVARTRDVIKNKYPKLLRHFKVIIAHFAQGNVGDYDVYNTIVQPNTYGDLSMLHGEGAKNFFLDFQKWFKQTDRINIDGRDWSEYLLFATDYPYFGEMHAQKLLINLFNKEFFNNGGSIQDIKNILGLNQIKLLPEYNIKTIIAIIITAFIIKILDDYLDFDEKGRFIEPVYEEVESSPLDMLDILSFDDVELFAAQGVGH
ncbi:MAG: hypothetical protein P8Y70_19855, partial [Candidatus Lokiarchaeota archaeon]